MTYPLVTLGVMAAVALGTVLYYYLKQDSPQTYEYIEMDESGPFYRSLQNQSSDRGRVFKPNFENSNDCCAICLDSLKAHQTKSVSCGHIYHEDCINKWLITKSTCPLCRAGTK